MHTKARFIPVLGFIILAGLSSCTNFFTTIHTNTASNDIQLTQVSKTKENLVPVTFTFKDPYASRAITSDSLVPDSYTFNFVSNTDAAHSFTQSLPVSNEYNIELEIGDNYSLTIQGFNTGILVCETTSSLTFTVQTGGALDPSPSIQMRPAGTGNLEVTYSWNDSTANIDTSAFVIDLHDAASTDFSTYISYTADDVAKTITITTSSPLPVGYYILTVDFSDAGGVVLSYKESVTIKAGQTSTSDKVTSGTTVNLGQSWFAVPPPEVQDAYYIVAPNGEFTVVWTDESGSAGLQYTVTFQDDGVTHTSADYKPLSAANTYAVRLNKTGVLSNVRIISINTAGTNDGTEVNSSMVFTENVLYNSNTFNVTDAVKEYFEMGEDVNIVPEISGTIEQLPELTNGNTSAVPSGNTYSVPQTAGISVITTNFADTDVDLTLYAVSMLPESQCYVSDSGDNSNTGESGSELATIDEAIRRLNPDCLISPSYTINVSGNHSLSGPVVLNSAHLPSNVTITGDGTAVLDAHEAHLVLSIQGDSKSYILSNLIIENGTNSHGGGLNISGTNTVTLNSCTIQNCSATSNGGGIYINGGTVTLNGCTIGKNIGITASEVGSYIGTYGYPNVTTASNKADSGAGIYLNAGFLSVQNSSISYNLTTSTAGGGIWINNGNIEVLASNICGNVCSYEGGGIGCASVLPVPRAKISNSKIMYNSSGGYSGGGIDCADLEISNSEISFNTSGNGAGIYTSKALLTGCSIKNNTAATNGGGIYKAGAGTLTISGETTFDGNQAQDGGALYQTDAGTTTFTGYSGGIVSNSASNSGGAFYINGGNINYSASSAVTITDNRAFSNGGAFYCGVGAGSVNFNGLNCTFSGNNVKAVAIDDPTGPGGAFYVAGGTLTIQNAQIYGCISTEGGAVYATGGSVNITDSEFHHFTTQTNGGAIYSNNSDLTIVGTSIHDCVVSGSGGGIYKAGTGDFSIDENSIIHINHATTGGAIMIADGSGGVGTVYNIQGEISNNSMVPGLTRGAAIHFGNNLSGEVTLGAIFDGYIYTDSALDPVIFVNSPNTNLHLVLTPDVEISSGCSIYLVYPSQITVNNNIVNEITLSCNDYTLYRDGSNKMVIVIPPIDITNIYLRNGSYKLDGDGYVINNP